MQSKKCMIKKWKDTDLLFSLQDKKKADQENMKDLDLMENVDAVIGNNK